MMNTKFQIYQEAKTPMHEYKLQSNYTKKTKKKKQTSQISSYNLLHQNFTKNELHLFNNRQKANVNKLNMCTKQYKVREN